MKNLTYKAVENSKNTIGEGGNNPAGGNGQLTEAQIRELVQIAADMGCTHFLTHHDLDTDAEMAANMPTYASVFNLRTLQADTRLWMDIIHEKGMKFVCRGTWSGIKANHGFPFATYGGANFVPLGTASDPAGSSTYCARLRRWMTQTIGLDYFHDGDMICPVSEATEFLSNANMRWFDTSGGVQAGFYNFFLTMKDVVESVAATTPEGKTFGFFTIVNYSEYYNSPGHYIDSTLPLDQGLIAIDYYGHNKTGVDGAEASPASYVLDWNDLKAEVAMTGGNVPIFQTEMGGIFNSSWPSLGINNGNLSPRVNFIEESIHYQMRYWKAYRDDLIDTGKMNGVSNWGLWAGQNSSIVFYSNGKYKPNYMGQIYGNFLKGNGMARVPVPSSTSFDSWGGRSNYF